MPTYAQIGEVSGAATWFDFVPPEDLLDRDDQQQETTLHDCDEVPVCEEPFLFHVEILQNQFDGYIHLLVTIRSQYSKCTSSSLNDEVTLLTLQLYA
jgi:hypothetical protein